MTALTRRRAAHSRDTCSFSSAGAVKTLVQVRVRAVRPEVGWPPKGSVKLERRRRRWWRPESRPEGVEPGQSRPPGACPAGAPPRVRPPCPPGWQLACCLVPEEIQLLAVRAEAKVRSPERGERWRPEAWRAPLQVCVRERPMLFGTHGCKQVRYSIPETSPHKTFHQRMGKARRSQETL